ncbi:MAG: 50S ribosomal protein L9 [Phycisphaerales bacterium]|jgi:large subunit ribosomal protein L9|nr:50S ribosomal protein L9 [Planctomycetaceae bacterium]MDP6157530.1 50S ribosomal protein L9 [Phycisphaerales bacterium]MDP6311542.1 50S ribosomal protein L9 [Phycisphaerales bacterium]MDP7086955.1 50S ribosomal protein L9 [Phycisphaerales bacterium]MDP7189609.1 50S ribosomal protein L9 [Phycisphaerales bacterium]|tara:strand:- start:3121 stop:3705 length:585 start_codon:yes stop_codon:yes gene_type:complete
MSRRTIELLLLENVENLGIVGDVVKVRTGYARNYLLPMQIAEAPSDERIEALQAERTAALARVAAQRADREELTARMEEVELTLVRSCNDRGGLYGSVTQRDIADALAQVGYPGIEIRAVRLPTSIRRIGDYEVPIQFEADLRVDISVIVEPDQPLEEREEMEFDDEGELIEKPEPKPKPVAEEVPAEEAAAEG